MLIWVIMLTAIPVGAAEVNTVDNSVSIVQDDVDQVGNSRNTYDRYVCLYAKNDFEFSSRYDQVFDFICDDPGFSYIMTGMKTSISNQTGVKYTKMYDMVFTTPGIHQIVVIPQFGTGLTYTVFAGSHSYKYRVIDPSCKESGYTLYYCINCPIEYKGNYVDATDHQRSDWIVEVEAQPGESGVRIKKCLKCGIELEREITPALPIPLVDFSLSTEDMSLNKGYSGDLLVMYYYPENTTSDKTATWKSDNPKVATVDANGTVTAVSSGKTNITCTIAGISKVCNVNVMSPLKDFSLSKSSLNMERDKTFSLKVISYDPSDTSDDKTAWWSSNNIEVATVDSNGIVKAVGKGICDITCQVGNIIKTCRVKVNAPLRTFTLNSTNLKLAPGKGAALKVKTYTPSDTDSSKKAIWKSSNTRVATVSTIGSVKAVSTGTATITCTVAGISKTCKITVGTPLTSFTLSKISVAVSKGKTYALKVTAYSPSNTTSSKTATWKSSNTKIATVDSKGVVKGIANGTATITCTVAGISKTCKITVGTPLTSFTLNKTSATVSKGKTYSLKVTAYSPSNTTSSKTATWKSSNTKIATVDSKGVVKGIANGTATITCTVAGIKKTCKITVGTPLTSFTLSKTSATVSKGKTYSLKVTAYSPSNTTSSKTATWKSSNTKIATVSSKGVVKGIANGTATITCTVAGIKKTCKITVGTPLTSFTLSKTSATVSKGKTYSLKVTAYSPSNTTSSKTATWKSSNTKIATVSSKGVVKGIANGTATITCTVAGIKKTCKITVGIPLKSFTLSKTSATVSKGKTYALKVTAYSPSNTTGSKTATWKSSNTKIATVSSKGVVKGIANGTATITCTVAGIKKTCKITVGIPLKSFTLSKTSATVSKGKTYALKVTAYSPSNTTSSKTATWKSSNTKIATVSNKGVVKGIAKGTATISCTVSGISKTCKITVK